MPRLPGVVESLDAVDEAFRPAYVEQDGKYVLDAEFDGHPVQAKLKRAIATERESRELTAKELKAFKDLGFSPEQIAEIKAKADAAKDDKQPDFERVLAKRMQEVEERFKPIVTEAESLRSENRRLKLTDKVRAAAIKAGVIEDEVDDVLRLTEAHFELDKEGRPIVLDDDGDPSDKTPEQWFTEVYKKQRPGRFKGTGGSGSGARGSAGTDAGTGTVTLTPEQAGNAATYAEALKKVGGDWSKVKVASP